LASSVALYAPTGAVSAQQPALYERALCLAGGGATGAAWESGVLLGLQRGGIDVNAADVVIGASAGSMVGARLRRGMSPDDLYRQQFTADASVLSTWSKSVDVAYLRATGGLWLTADHALSQAERAAVGARALGATLPSEEDWMPTFYRWTGTAEFDTWPAKTLEIVAVDTADGSVSVFDRTQNVPIKLALAASNAIPAYMPPITIGTHRYMDGSVAGDNLLVAHGYATVLGLVPFPTGGTLANVAALQAQGAHVVLIAPDADAKVAMGPSMLDISRKPASADAGLRQGLANAAALGALWRS
jgi:NTE family protein